VREKLRTAFYYSSWANEQNCGTVSTTEEHALL
jgi:hypothetical protein